MLKCQKSRQAIKELAAKVTTTKNFRNESKVNFFSMIKNKYSNENNFYVEGMYIIYMYIYIDIYFSNIQSLNYNVLRFKFEMFDLVHLYLNLNTCVHDLYEIV